MFLTFLLVSSIYVLDGWNALRNGFQKRQYTLSMQQYEHAKEYFDFYNEFKQPILTSCQMDSSVGYQLFAEKNKDKYFIFEKNLKRIQDANALFAKQNNSLQLGLNQYADTVDFNNNYNTDLMINTISKNEISSTTYLKILQSPINYIDGIINKYKNKLRKYNWNDTGLLSPVKNQGQCGSCWAFSTTTALETFMRIRNYSVERLSEQELVDCSTKDYGCNGGMMHTAFDYIIKNGGLYDNKDYEYIAETQNCSKPLNISKVPGSDISKYRFVIPNSILDMKLSLLQNPVAIAVDADNIYFRFYKDGVIDVPLNVSKALNHAVLLVGYDYDEQGEYWIIQNSWGRKWGINGFGKIRIQPNEGTLLCQSYGVYPTK